MELSQSLKKRYSLGIGVDNCPCAAPGFRVAGKTYGVDKATNQKETDTFLIHGNTIQKHFHCRYLNKMELSHSFKKRCSLGVEVDNCSGTAAGFCVVGSTYGADKATNQREIDNFLIHRSAIQKNFNIFT